MSLPRSATLNYPHRHGSCSFVAALMIELRLEINLFREYQVKGMQMYQQQAQMSNAGYFAPLPPQRDGAAQTDGRMDIHGLYLVLKRRLPLIIFVTTIAVGIAVVYLMNATRMYSSSAKILIDPRQKIIVGAQVTSGGLGFDKALMGSQVKIINSDAVLRRVVITYKLAEDSEFTGKPGFSDRLKMWLGFPKPHIQTDPQARALETLYKRLSVKRPNQTYVIEVSIESESPEKAAKLAQGVADAYLADQSAAKINTTRQASRLLNERLDELRDRVRDAETKIESFKNENNILAAEGRLVNEKRLNRLNDQLLSVRLNTSQSLVRYESIRSFARSGIDLDTTYEAVNSALISRLRTQYAEIARRESNLKATLGSSHPLLISARAQLARTRSLIQDELSRIEKTARNEYEIALAREKAVVKNLKESRNDVDVSNGARIKLRELEREAVARRTIFQSFLVRARETKEQENLQTADARIISTAAIPINASSPRRKLILVMAFATGLGLGMLLALVVELFSGKGVNAGNTHTVPLQGNSRQGYLSDDNAWMQMPPMPAAAFSGPGQGGGGAEGAAPAQPLSIPAPVAYIPRLIRANGAKPMSRAGVAHPEAANLTDFASTFYGSENMPASPYRVAIHGLLQQLGSPEREKLVRQVLLCAPETGEGTTSVTYSLATAASVLGNRSLMVDADSSRPDLSHMLAAQSRLSIADVLSEYASLEQIIIQNDHFTPALLPLVPPHGYALGVDSQQLLLQRLTGLARKFQYVFIDGGAVRENHNLSGYVEHADDVFLVVREGAHIRSEIAHSLNTLGVGADKFRGVVVAMADHQSMSRNS